MRRGRSLARCREASDEVGKRTCHSDQCGKGECGEGADTFVAGGIEREEDEEGRAHAGKDCGS
jgi:hypothetical protein